MAVVGSDELAAVCEHAVARLASTGGLLIPASREPGHLVHVPFALLPRPMPQSAFDAACALAEPFNLLVDRIARDPEWLLSVLKRTGDADPFTGRLMRIFEAVLAEGIRQPLYLGVHRSDYMIDEGADGCGRPTLRQIELNTVSAAFAGLSAQVTGLHKHLLSPCAVTSAAGVVADLVASGHAHEAASAAASPSAGAAKAGATTPPSRPALPPNASSTTVPDALASAYQRYAEQRAEATDASAAGAAAAGSGGRPRRLVVAFVVQPSERNIMDQRILEYRLTDHYHVPVRRVTLAYLGKHAVVRGAAAAAGAAGAAGEGDWTMLLPPELPFAAPAAAAAAADASASGAAAGAAATGAAASAASAPDYSGWDEVAVVYYRSGYAPTDYPSEVEWAGRLLAERSAAVKCPPIAYHLVGTKKVQQVLAAPGQVERFLPPAAAAHLRSCFAGLWPLDPAEATAESKAAIARALANPHGFVVKPQREGGGNNIYGDHVAVALSGAAAASAGVTVPATVAAAAAAAAAGGSIGGVHPMGEEELAAHILMERVFPRESPAYLVRGGCVTSAPVVSELGVYGVFLSDASGAVHENTQAGHLLRTKGVATDEGGVAAGFAVLDSPLLFCGY